MLETDFDITILMTSPPRSRFVSGNTPLEKPSGQVSALQVDC